MVWSVKKISGIFLGVLLGGLFFDIAFAQEVVLSESALVSRASGLPWPVMSLILGLIDGFNPCAMWSLIVLIGFLLSMENQSRRWLIGGIFIGSSFLLYGAALFAYLLGFQSVVALTTGSLMTWIFRLVGVVSLGAGVLAIREGIQSKSECSIRDAGERKKFHQKMTEILERKNLWWLIIGVVGLAFSVNAIELLCSFAIPTTFTGILASPEAGLPFWKQISAILVYDIAYIFDDILVFVIAMKTLNVKMFTGRATIVSHWIGGIVLLIIGGVLLVRPDILSLLIS